MHQVCLCLFCLDVRQSADASMVAECLCRGLEKMSSICAAKGRTPPRKMIIWVPWQLTIYHVHFLASCQLDSLCTLLEADNCVRENKNNTILKLLSWLLLQKGMECTGILFGRVGHTHGPLGALSFPCMMLIVWSTLNCLEHPVRSNLWGPEPCNALR